MRGGYPATVNDSTRSSNDVAPEREWTGRVSSQTSNVAPPGGPASDPRAVLQEVLDLINRPPDPHATVAVMRRISGVLQRAGKLLGVSLIVTDRTREGERRWNVKTLRAMRENL